MKKLLLVLMLAVSIYIGVEFIHNRDTTNEQDTAEVNTSSTENTVETEIAKIADETILDVPLLNQMDSPRLYNGCEVTSLAMILNYWGIEVTKNELADDLTIVPLKYSNGEYGNPNVGFVGDMENGPGLGVYHSPVYKLAKTYAGDRVDDLTGKSFDTLIQHLSNAEPVWVITTTTFSPVSDMQTWDTPQGSVDITYKMHSVAITGYNDDYIYVNDPYGVKDRKVDRTAFIEAWEQMGSQAIVITAEES